MHKLTADFLYQPLSFRELCYETAIFMYLAGPHFLRTMSSRNRVFIPHAARTAVPAAMRAAVIIFITRVWLLILGMAGLLPSAPGGSSPYCSRFPAHGRHSPGAVIPPFFLLILNRS